MTEKSRTYPKPPPLTIDKNKKYIASIETNKGTMLLQLYAADAPVTVNNFVFLAREGYYDNTTFHRVIADFMAQGGDPTGTGRGGPGYTFKDEISKRIHVTGTLSMANAGPNTNGSQFFICFAPQPHLNGKHTVFGQLVQGTNVLNKITQGDKIIKVTIKEE
jgi:peptidyl-prolyl cis-trans isomerase B (cyclophilin B)